MAFEAERAEWRELTNQLNIQARGIADRLLARGPSVVQRLGPQMERYRETNDRLERLSRRVGGVHSGSDKAPDW